MFEMPQWPTGKDAFIEVEWSQAAYDRAHASQAVLDAMTIAGVEYGWRVIDNSNNAVPTLKDAISNGSGIKRDGIILFPYEDVDYTDCMRSAAEANVAVHVMQTETPEEVFYELCGLYGIEDRVFHPDGDTAWPQESDAMIVVLYRDTDEADQSTLQTLKKAINSGLDEVGFGSNLGDVSLSRDQSVEALLMYLDRYSDLKGICVFPFGDLDYSAAVEKANEKGVALHFIESTEPEYVKSSIIGLYDTGEQKG